MKHSPPSLDPLAGCDLQGNVIAMLISLNGMYGIIDVDAFL
jgi:hypothetical protein